MHAEPGCTIERCRGTRAATTPRKLPKASPGTNTSGRTKSITLLSTPARRRLSARRDSVSAAVVEVRRRVDPESARWLLDRERSDRDRRGGAAALLPQDPSLRAGDAGAPPARPRPPGNRVGA